ncbi:GHKL domain-containing protein [Lachnospiraceae bacterium 62-35]
MNRQNTILPLVPACILVFLIFLSAILLSFHSPARKNQEVRTIKEWQMDGQVVSLPHTFQNLSPATPLSLTAQLNWEGGDYLYLKTVYAPLKVFVDGRLIFEYGQSGSYPAFLLDPPTKVALFPLPDTARTVTFQMEYLSPTQRSSATLHPVIIGTSTDIVSQLFGQMGFSLFFSIVLIALGLILALISFILIRLEQTGISFFWLGMFSLATGFWVFGECNLTGLFIPNPFLLYLMAFTGLFTMPIPLIKFCLVLPDIHEKYLLKALCLVLECCVSLALFFQLAGIFSLSKTMYLFHVLIPLTLCISASFLLRESIQYRNLTASRFFLPLSVLAFFALIEVGNYYLFHFDVQKSFFFQIGVLLFIIMTSILCGYFIRDTLTLRARNRQLSYEVSLMEKQVSYQKERYQLLSETSAQIRQQRHDLKHHLTVIQSWLDRREPDRIAPYVDELSAKIPEEPFQTLCENEAVNAVALHYQTSAQNAGIACMICLDIPRDTGTVPESSLCVIVGNLLENAITACREADKPFIRIQSRFSDGILTITMDNNYSSLFQEEDGTFRSTKAGGGIGLASIHSIVQKHGGNCRFQAENGIFFSSIYLRLF